jgi:hypothetical protein
MILLTKGATADIFTLTGLDTLVLSVDYDTITNYTILFTYRGDPSTTVSATLTDSSNYPARYQKFTINTSTTFLNKPYCIWDYTLTLNGVLDGDVVAVEVETGTMKYIESTSKKLQDISTEYTPTYPTAKYYTPS